MEIFIIDLEVAITQKLITALCRAIPILTIDWLVALADTCTIPALEDYIPPFTSLPWAAADKAAASLLPNLERKILLKDVGLVVFGKSDYSALEMTAKDSCGKVTLCTLSNESELNLFLQEFKLYEHVVLVGTVPEWASVCALSLGIRTIGLQIIYQTIICCDMQLLKREFIAPVNEVEVAEIPPTPVKSSARIPPTPLTAIRSAHVSAPTGPFTSTPLGPNSSAPIPPTPIAKIRDTSKKVPHSKVILLDDAIDIDDPVVKEQSTNSGRGNTPYTKISTKSLFQHYSTSVSQAPDHPLPDPSSSQLTKQQEAFVSLEASQYPKFDGAATQMSVLDSFMDDILGLGSSNPAPVFPVRADYNEGPKITILKNGEYMDPIPAIRVPYPTAKVVKTGTTIAPPSITIDESIGEKLAVDVNPLEKYLVPVPAEPSEGNPKPQKPIPASNINPDINIQVAFAPMIVKRPDLASTAPPLPSPKHVKKPNFKRFRQKNLVEKSLISCVPAAAFENVPNHSR